ncbi:hypothetical protein [Novosphingobium malaysiense]|uniref:hypothetical protein n=1 Tax=Novosphingobium malaysiense TaxID=1348853 RepID=UPI0012E0181C|nr:hypothetical protein [Novosphingobium malaysiense]
MSVLLIAAAAALSAPSAKTAMPEYPVWAARKDRSAGIIYELVVDPQGKPIRCDTLRFAGDEKLALAICPLLIRTRYRPATLADGTPATGLIRSFIYLVLDGSAQANAIRALQVDPDVILNVNHLPDGTQSLDADLVLQIDKTGGVVDCAAGAKQAPGPIIDAVCANREVLTQPPRQDAQGNPLEYVTNLKVRLVAASASS